MSSKADVIEAEAFLYKYPETEAIDLLIADTNGVLRGKRIKRDVLHKAYVQGIALPASIFGTAITGDKIQATGLGFAEGDADRVCWPLADTLVSIPWQTRSMAQVLMTMCEADDSPFFADPRQILNKVLVTFAELNLQPVTAIELEFYFIDPERLGHGAPQPPLSSATGRRDHQSHVYSMQEIDAYTEVLDAIMIYAEIQDIPADTAVAEYAPAQFEVNLKHIPNPLLACDQLLMLKRLIRAVARKHDMDVTFMAKPYADWSGNGMHVHVSLVDDKDHNIFQQQDSALLKHAIGGVAATLPEAMALLAPHANSYRRFRSNSYAPQHPVWGHNNRTVALRIPQSPDEEKRIEHRLAGGDANPYLVMATLLAGMHYGISNNIEPDAAVQGNAYEQDLPQLPATWLQAQQRLEAATVLPDYLGQEFCRVYLATKQAEWQQFNQQITALEYDWLLHAI